MGVANDWNAPLSSQSPERATRKFSRHKSRDLIHLSHHQTPSLMIDLGKRNLLGVNIDALDYEGAISRFMSAAVEGRRYTTTALAVHGVMTGVLDPEHRYRLNRFDMVVPDGMPVRWGLNWLHRTCLPDRVYGPTLMLKICEAAAEKATPIFLFGTDQPTLESLSSHLLKQFPKLEIAGMEPSKFRKLSQDESKALSHRIQTSGAKITFVGLGCPRQEIWAYEMGDQLNMPLFAVGAAFAFHAGKLSQSPSWMQKRGLEWLYRLMCEPRRLWRRYLFLNPLYLTLLAMQWTGLNKPDPNSTVEPREQTLYG